MVNQSEHIEFITGKLTEEVTSEIEVGESATVDYSDNALDTVHETLTEVTTTVTDNKIQDEALLTSGLAVGDDVDSYLITKDGKAINKVLFTSFAKTISLQTQIRNTSIYILD